VKFKDTTGETVYNAAFQFLTGSQTISSEMKERRGMLEVICNSCGNEFEYDPQKLLKYHKQQGTVPGGKTTKIVLFVVFGLLIILGIVIYALVKSQGGSFQIPK
jgi:hypothetical protein